MAGISDHASESAIARYFAAGKWWLNDPDALVGNNRPLEGFRAWATLASVSGSVLSGLCGHHAVTVVARFGADTRLDLVPTSRYLYSG